MDTTELPDDLIELAEASALAKAHVASLYRWIKSGKLRGWSRHGRTFVSRAEVLAQFKPIPCRRRNAPTRKEGRQAAEARERSRQWAKDFLRSRGIIP